MRTAIATFQIRGVRVWRALLFLPRSLGVWLRHHASLPSLYDSVIRGCLQNPLSASARSESPAMHPKVAPPHPLWLLYQNIPKYNTIPVAILSQRITRGGQTASQMAGCIFTLSLWPTTFLGRDTRARETLLQYLPLYIKILNPICNQSSQPGVTFTPSRGAGTCEDNCSL